MIVGLIRIGLGGEWLFWPVGAVSRAFFSSKDLIRGPCIILSFMFCFPDFCLIEKGFGVRLYGGSLMT